MVSSEEERDCVHGMADLVALLRRIAEERARLRVRVCELEDAIVEHRDHDFVEVRQPVSLEELVDIRIPEIRRVNERLWRHVS